ncbi:hypothetical protein ACFC26_14830 [Kitasatospora purpeofusca]|uniref:hypothetical protein n=1 Tax=Kitasatospora purpeofusca TaxID=67352 RepID=UPI0035E218E1
MSNPAPPARPADPSQVGTALVLHTLGVERLVELPGWHDEENTPLAMSAEEVVRIARRLDRVQQNMVTLATTVRRDMQRVIDGDDIDLPHTHGILGSTAQSLDLLSARRTELYQHLDRIARLHKALAESDPPASRAGHIAGPPARAEERSAAGPAREARLNTTQRAMLEAVADGRITVHSIGTRDRMSAPGLDLSPASVNVLIKRNLVERDTSTSLYSGQRLRLTAAGARVHATLTGTPPAASTPAPAAPAVAAAVLGVAVGRTRAGTR